MIDLSSIENKEDFMNRPSDVRNYQTFKKEFDEEIHRAADSYVRIGYLLIEARDTGILEGSGYTSMGDFAKTEYGLSPDQTSRFISVCERFGDGEGHLKTEYEDFGQTKLIEMLTLPDSVTESIPPDLTREEIRDIKNEVKKEQEVTPIERAIESSDIPQGLNDLETFIYIRLKDFKVFKKYWETMKTIAVDDKGSLLTMIEPSGIAVLSERVPRRGMILLSFNGTENKPALVDVRQDTRSEIEWEDLCEAITMRLYPEDIISVSPETDYEMTYGPVEIDTQKEPESKSPTNFEENKPQKEENAETENSKTRKVSQEAESGEQEERKVSQALEKSEADTPESKSPTNIEQSCKLPASEESVSDTEPEPVQGNNVETPGQVTDPYIIRERVKRAAKDLDETLNLHIIDIPMLRTSYDIQEGLDKVEEKIATWRNLMIEWRKSREY